MKGCDYRVYSNGRLVARGCYRDAVRAFYDECAVCCPFEDSVILTDHFMKPLKCY